MDDPIAERRQRPWRLLVSAVIVVIVVMLALAMWSEREDARRLPAEEMQGREGATEPAR